MDDEEATVCYSPTMITTLNVWKGDNPLDYSLPLFVLQLTLVIAATRLFDFILRPLRQPRVVAEILGGLLLGPSVLGQSENFTKHVFPLKSMLVVEGLSNLGLILFLFLVGLELDISALKSTTKKPFLIAIVGMVPPFAVGAGAFFFLSSSPASSHGPNILFLGVALSVTAFPVLARILAELKLLNTDLGRLALSTALVNDVAAWLLLVLGIALASSPGAASSASLYVILSSIAFVFICFFLIRPFIKWFLKDVPDAESFSDLQICVVLTGVMVASFATDAIGAHAIFGAYVYGLTIPNGPIAVALIERLEDFVSGLLLPLFCANSGLKTNVMVVKGVARWVGCLMVIPLACAGKVLGTVVVGLFFNVTAREGVILGLLMNTKGLIEIIVLNVARDLKVMNDEIFTMMVIVTIVMTALVSPIVAAIYRPTRRFIPYKKRTVQGLKFDAERKILVCVHNTRNVPTLINLLEASNPTRKSPLSIYLLHLVELTGRVSTMLVDARAARKSAGRNRPSAGSQMPGDYIINAFENFAENGAAVSVHPLTAISPYSTMHQDICTLAEDKRVCVIIIPFHKQKTVDGEMEDPNPAFRMVNQKLLQHSPCSIGILVDRGLNVSARISSASLNAPPCLNVAVLFFGGPHDREALAYAWRMVEWPGISITVTHFVPGEEAMKSRSWSNEINNFESQKTEDVHHHKNNNTDGSGSGSEGSGSESDLNIYSQKEREKNDEYMNEFRWRTSKNENGESVVRYVEKIVNNSEETVGAIGSMKNGYDLFIVGRDQGVISPLTDGLTDWSEYPELGAIGDLLASTDFGTTASVLVMQQCDLGEEIRVENHHHHHRRREDINDPNNTKQKMQQFGGGGVNNTLSIARRKISPFHDDS